MRKSGYLMKVINENTLGQAFFLETDYFKKMQIVISNGIARAIKGE